MSAHPHAELMLMYAIDAKETVRPWERWQYQPRLSGDWFNCVHTPTWSPDRSYRRRPDLCRQVYEDWANEDGLGGSWETWQAAWKAAKESKQ